MSAVDVSLVTRAHSVDLSAINRGEIAIWKHGLSLLGLREAFCTMALDAVEGAAIRWQPCGVEFPTFDDLHSMIAAHEVVPTIGAMTKRFTHLSHPLVQLLIASGCQAGSDVYVADASWPRIMLPYDIACRDAGAGRHVGQAAAHNPHRDSWFSQPVNAVNIWIALSPVVAGNGLLLFPDAFGKPLYRDGLELSRRQAPGRSLVIAMEPGDILFFSGEHLHSSEVNTTDRTRFVVSFRSTCGVPLYHDGIGQTSYSLL